MLRLIDITPAKMNEELSQRVTQFQTAFLEKYPRVDQPLTLISDFSVYLNKVKAASTEHGETINSILVLLSNSDLERFADADFKPGMLAESGETGDHADSGDAGVIERGANEAVNGNAETGLAGLKELVAKLIGEL